MVPAVRAKKARGPLRASNVTSCRGPPFPLRTDGSSVDRRDCRVPGARWHTVSASRSEAQLTEEPTPAAPSALPAELADWPACTLGEAQLGDLELLTSGAFAPLRGFMDAAEVTAVTEHGTLADGTPWPVPVTLDVPAGAVPDEAAREVLQDPDGSPLAVLAVTERPPGASALVRP